MVLSFIVSSAKLFAQAPSCDPSVPFWIVDLTGNPTGSWTSPTHSRNGDCCYATGGDQCTSFMVTLDSNAAMVEIGFDLVTDPSQALPSGSMDYSVNCGPLTPIGSPICISGVGPHYITFCKPGNNQNTYYIKSIAKPVFPNDDTVRIGCSTPIQVLGFEENSVTWQSISPGVPGQYDTYLNCTTGCDTVMYTPPLIGAPPFVKYRICGNPIADECGYVAVCDTVTIYNFAALTGDVVPDTAMFCAGGPGALLEAFAFGGSGPYEFIWRNESAIVVSDSSEYLATTEETFQVEIRDGLFHPAYCPAIFLPALVIITDTAVVDAGSSQTLCYNDAQIFLNGTASNTSSISWSGGNGTFTPNNTYLNSIYNPTSAEINAGSVTLYLTGNPSGFGCSTAIDSVTIFFTSPIHFNMTDVNVLCFGDSATLNPGTWGGSSPYVYLWSTGAASTTINVPQGNYCVSVTDNNGCVEDTCVNVIAPPALTLGVTSSNVSVNGGSDGFGVALPGGGTLPYTFLWNDPSTQTNDTAFNLSYGIYNVILTDGNGCSISTNVVVNEPRCSSFTGTLEGFNPVSCFDGNDGAAWISISGGNDPYSIFWSDPLVQNNDTAINLFAGVYQALVVDSNGCFDLVNVSIPEPAYLYLTINHSNVTVQNGNDGSATANPFGGTPLYNYSWTDSLGNFIASTPTINSLVAGWYYITVTDDNGCSFSDSVYINQPPCNNLIISTQATNVACYGQSNGSASVTVLLGQAPYVYTWRDALNNIVGTSASVTNLPAGSYTIEVVDSNQCQAFGAAIITEPSDLEILAAQTNPSCYNSYNGTIEITVSGGIYPYSYLWNTGITVQDLYNLNEGSFFVTVTDANGCMDTATIKMSAPAELSATLSVSSVTCYNGNNGSINLTPSGGVTPYSYTWSNTATTQDISGVSSGVYSVTITDYNGCTSSELIGYVPQPLPILNDSIAISCPVPGTGVAMVEFFPTGGSQSDYQISYNNGISFDDIDTTTAYLPIDSTYIILVRDSNACISFIRDTISINPETEITNITFNPCTPFNATNTNVEVFITGGTGPNYQVSFNNGAVFSGSGIYSDSLAVGNSYLIVVRDTLGCISLMDSIYIPAPINLSGVTSLYNGVNVSCFGFTDGSIDASMSGWVSPYAYEWNTTDTTQDLSNIGAGSYELIITDQNNCTDSISFTLIQPTIIGLTSNVTTNYNGYSVSCYGYDDANIDLSVSGGTTPYDIEWSNNAISEDLSNVGAGSYEAIITDLNGCQDSITSVVTQPDSIYITYTSQNILCNSFNTGSIDITVTGGVTSYNYSWSSGQSTEDLTNIPSGLYEIVITDQNGCEDSIEVNIVEPTDVAVSASLTQVLCYNDSTAAIDLTVGGGTGSYTYDWSNGDVTQDLANIPAGSYTVVVMDANNCTDTTSYIISQPAELVGTILATSNYNGFNVSCYGSTNGTIDVTASGGVTPYQYLWSTTDTTEDLSGVGAGNYLVQVTDSNGCFINLPITLTSPTQLSVTGIVNNVLCFGFNNGSIDITTSGGIPTYTFAWSNSSSSEDISNVGPGTYSVTITDDNGCTITYTNQVNELSPLVINSTAVNPSCSGFNNASINISMQGGMAPYSFTWSTGDNTEDIDSLIAGSYIVTVIDSNNCSSTDTIQIFEPQPLTLDLNATIQGNGYNISFFGGSDGYIYSLLNGGTAPYQFLWSTGETSSDLSNVPAGTYILNVTDDNGCLISDTITLTQPDSLDMPTGYTPNNDGYNDAFIVKGIDNYPDNYITVINRWGNVVFEQESYNNTWKGENQNGRALPDGTYFVILEVRSIPLVLKSYVDIRR